MQGNYAEYQIAPRLTNRKRCWRAHFRAITVGVVPSGVASQIAAHYHRVHDFGGSVSAASPQVVNVSGRLKNAVEELRRVDRLLLSGELDPRILTDFRDALNRVRNTAWSAQQYLTLKDNQQDSNSVLSLLAGERIRAMYQLCRALVSDLDSADVRFQSGQLAELHAAIKKLADRMERGPQSAASAHAKPRKRIRRNQPSLH